MMNKNILAFEDELCALVGKANVLTTDGDIEGYVNDWTGQFKSDALAVVRPANTQEVSAVVKLCAARNIAVVPQGGNTGLCGGGTPISNLPSIVLSLSRMNKIRAIDSGARTIVTEAGVILEAVHQAVLKHDLVFPLMFGAKGSCSIGGNLATNAGGSNVVRYGNTRELCIGIEAVLPDGTIINALTGLRKDNTGYDLKNLLIGAEGTLGVITAAVFKLFPEPKVRATAFLSVPSLEGAVSILNRLQDHTGGAVEAFEYLPQTVVDVICDVFPDIRQPLDNRFETGILIEVASSRPHDAQMMDDGTVRLTSDVMEFLGELMQEELVLDAMIAQSNQQRDDLWKMRESVLESITECGPAYHMDISLPLASVATFVAKMDAVSVPLGFQPLTIGHLGDGNLHYALSAAKGQDWDKLPLAHVKDRAYEILSSLNGSFSAEHGIGQSKLSVMTQLKETSQLTAMRAIKAALDPSNIMNPKKLVPQA